MRTAILAAVLAVPLVSATGQGPMTDPLERRAHEAPAAPASAAAGPPVTIELAGDNVCNPRVQVCES